MLSHARYRIVRTLGRGGMGEVWLADDLLLDRQVALKFLAAAAGDGAPEQLLAEARAAAALDHPFICSIYEVTTFDGRPCIAMEYVRGETLEERLHRGALPVADALRIAEEIAEALQAAHKRRVIHGDLKPANVMLTEEAHVKVMDFGLATRLPASADARLAAEIVSGRRVPPLIPSTAVQTIRGTPAYMAPEQIRGETPDRRSDIFAFGILLYQMLSAVNPFRRHAVDATLAAILNDAAGDIHRRVPGLPEAVSAAVARMLAKDRHARYQSFADVRLELRRAAADQTASRPVGAITVARAPDERRPPLIGRASEHTQLRDVLEQIGTGRGAFLVIRGEGGLGKTRLAEAALDDAQRRGYHALVGRCYEQDGAPPLVAYMEVLEAASRLMPPSVFRQAVGDAAPELARLLPDLHRLVPDMPPPLELPPALRQRYLFTTVRDFLARASRPSPTVILLDDLQWADEATLHLTQFLAQSVSGMPVLLLAAFRDGGSRAPTARGIFHHLLDRVRGPAKGQHGPGTVKDGLEQLVVQGLARSLTLRPLSEADVHELLGTLAGQEPAVTVTRQFLEHTGGNPYFLAELFRHLRDNGRLFEARGGWKRRIELDDIDVPDPLRSVIDRRLQQVSADAQRVLKTAALIGGRFELELLEAVADADPETVMAALEEGERAGLVRGPSGRQEVAWRFTHQLIVHSLVAALPAGRRQRLHLRIAEALERLVSAPQVALAGVAHHLYNAGRVADSGRTARALMAAGDAADAMYATHEAVQHYRRALEIADEADIEPPTRLAITERLADLLALRGDHAAARTSYEELAASYATGTNRVAQARISRKIGALHWQAGQREEALRCYRRAQDALDGAAASMEAAYLYQELGLVAFRSGDNAQAIAWAERSLACAEALLDEVPADAASARKEATTVIAHATNTMGIALARSGDLDGARERIERSISAARSLGLLDVACRGYANLGVLYSALEPQRAIDVSLTGLELASRIGAAALQSYIYANLAAAYCALTDRCESEGLRAARAAADLDRQIGQLDHLAVPLIVIAQIHQCRGELQLAHQHYTEALAISEKTGEPQLILPCYDGLATICLDRGERERAAEYMERAHALCERAGLDPDTLLLLPFLS